MIMNILGNFEKQKGDFCLEHILKQVLHEGLYQQYCIHTKT